jgi:hypothetical protein
MMKARKLEIDKKILEKTTKCHMQFACLNNKKHVCCEINCCVNGEICFINSKDKEPCPYKEGLGINEKCTCPVRIAIHNKSNLSFENND